MHKLTVPLHTARRNTLHTYTPNRWSASLWPWRTAIDIELVCRSQAVRYREERELRKRRTELQHAYWLNVFVFPKQLVVHKEKDL